MELQRQNQLLQNIKPEIIALAQEIERLNDIYIPFPLNDEQILRWATTVYETEKAITPEVLEGIIKKYIKAELYWDKNLGVANIFKAYAPNVFNWG